MFFREVSNPVMPSRYESAALRQLNEHRLAAMLGAGSLPQVSSICRYELPKGLKSAPRTNLGILTN